MGRINCTRIRMDSALIHPIHGTGVASATVACLRASVRVESISSGELDAIRRQHEDSLGSKDAAYIVARTIMFSGGTLRPLRRGWLIACSSGAHGLAQGTNRPRKCESIEEHGDGHNVGTGNGDG